MAKVTEMIIARRRAKSNENKPKSDRPPKRYQEQSFQTDKKEGSTSAVNTDFTSKPNQMIAPPEGSDSSNRRGARRPSDRPSLQYSFKDDNVETFFKLLKKGGRNKLPELR